MGVSTHNHQRFSRLLAMAFAALFLLPLTASAQFFTNGDDPFGKWYSIESPNYKIIYPKGLDSLARVYARKMEEYRTPVSLTSGFLPGQSIKGKMPVVLHAYNAVSNGSVAWAPKRMDAFTLPDMYGAEAQPWADQLAVHESRHISQMQFGISRSWKPFKYIFGEMFNGLSAGLLTETSFLEGDAVIAETELTKTGRGRSADFLNYYMVCFDQGDLRDWNRWRYGSQKYYVPDHYAIGYLTYGGIRWYYDNDDFTVRYLDESARKPYLLWVREVIAKDTGGLNVVKSFDVVADSLAKAWKKQADKRAPYMPMERISSEPRKYADYTDLFMADGDLYCFKEGHNDSRILIKMETDGEDRGEEDFITHFSTQTGLLHYSPEAKDILWSESVPDGRWSLKATSRIRKMKLGQRKKKNLNFREWLYNPIFSPDGKQIAAVQLLPSGGSKVVIENETTGERELIHNAPDSLQLTELVWSDEGIFATAISDGGYGIYRLNDGEWAELLEPMPVKLHSLKLHEGQVQFTSDHSGVNELYSLDVSNGELFQLTSTRYGAREYEYSEDGEWLYYSSQTIKGMAVFRTKTADLTPKPVKWKERSRWLIADKLTEQAERRAEKLYGDKDFRTAAKAHSDSVKLSEPKRWYKLPHLFNFHSWAPFYFNISNVMNFSGEKVTDYISLGATSLFQNQLGTADGGIGYSTHPNADENRWVHAGHFYLRYSGWYPVIEAEVNVGERSARQYGVQALQIGQASKNGIAYGLRQFGYRLKGKPYTEVKLKMSIPWNLSSGGWYRHLKPSLSYSFTNDRYDTRIQTYSYQGTERFLADEAAEDFKGSIYNGYGSFSSSASTPRAFDGVLNGRNVFRQNLSGSLLYYSLLPTTNSAEYPRWGWGAEAGFFTGLFHKTGISKQYGYSDIISPVCYGRIFAYTPGVTREQGLKLSLLWQHRVNPKAFFGQSLSILPRGFENKYPLNQIGGQQSDIFRISADYAIPIYVGDKAILGDCIFIKRLLLIPYCDCTVYDRGELAASFGGASAFRAAGLKTMGKGCFLSYGTQIILDMTNILWLSLPMRLGIDISLNGAPGFREMDRLAAVSGTKIKKYFVGPVFELSF